MASKNTRKKVQQAVNEMPVTPVTISFRWELNPTGKYKGVTLIEQAGVQHLVSSLPKAVEGTLTFERLKGMKYDPAFQILSAFVGVDSVYEMKKVKVSTAFTEEPIEASWSTLTKTESLIGWMMQNATKLYLSPMDRKLGRPFQDRNFTELCGSLIASDPSKVYGSASMLKAVKDDIRDIKEVQKIADDRLYMESPLHALRNHMINLEGMADALLAYRKEQKETRLLKAANK
jgi:hypothetical protein